MADAHNWLIHELFVPVLALVDELSQAANETEAVDYFGCDKNRHWCSVGQALGKADADHPPRHDLADSIRTIAAIHEGTQTQCNTYPDVAIYLYRRRDALKQAAQQGWTAAKQGGSIPEDPFPVSPAENVAFLEAVRDEVRYAADAKRQQLAKGYSNDTLASMVRGIKWGEAGQRVSMLSELPADAVEQVARVLRRELTPGTVEQIDELLTPGVCNLRDAWECSRGATSPTGDILEALLSVQRELERWNSDNSPSETGYLVEDVPTGHPLHSAVATLQRHYGGALPKPALGHWRNFLKLARNDDEDAEDEADSLLEWVNAEIESHRAGALPQAVEVTSDGQIRLADWAVATHGVLLDQINLGPRPGFGNKFPISDFDAIVVDGDTPTVCPKTDRPIPAEWLPTIEEVFKRVGLVKPGQTIHWVGGQAKLENVCTCFREGFPKPAATLTGNAPNGGDLIEQLLTGPDDAELSPRELAMLEAHLAQPVSMAAIQREKQANGESETNAKRNKLKLIRDFNRKLQGPAPAANEANLAAEKKDEAANGEPASQPVLEAPTKSRGGWMGDVELAETLGVHSSRIPAFRAKLKRMRDKVELSIDDWQEIENRKRNEPQFLYRANAPAIVAMAKRYSLPK